MNPADLRKSLRLLPTVVSILGKEPLLIQEARDAVLSVFAPDQDLRDFNVDTLSGPPTKESRALLAEDPVSSDFRLVFLETDDPDAYLTHKPHTTVLVTLTKPFKEAQLEIDCRRPYGKELRHWIRSEGKRQSVELDKQDVDQLAAESPHSLRKLRDDIFKLAVLGQRPNQDTIHSATHSTVHNTGWDILKHVVAGNITKAADTLVRVKASGTSPLQVISALQRTFTSLYLLVQGADPGVSDLDKERLEKLRARFSKKSVRDCLQDLLRVEHAMKSSDSTLEDIWVVARIAQRAA